MLKTLVTEKQGVSLLKNWYDYVVDYNKEFTAHFGDGNKESQYILRYFQERKEILPPFNYYWFLEELKKFENQFCEYLKNEISITKIFIYQM